MLEKILLRWQKYNKIIKIFVTVILLIILFYKIDIKKSLILFREINFLILIPLLLYPFGILISSFKWKTALKEEKLSLFFLSKIYWISNFFSNFLPSTIAGDSYKIIRLKKDINWKRITKSVILDRGSGLITLCLILSLLSPLVYTSTNNLLLAFFPLGILLGITLFLLIFRIIQSSLTKKIYCLIMAEKKIILQLIILSLGFIFLGSFSLWIYYLMYGYHLSLLTVLLFYSIIQIVNMIPISINGWGIREGGIIYLFGLIGVPSEISLSIALLSRLVMLFQTSVGGLIYLFEKSK